MEHQQVTADRFLRRPEVEALTGLARATIYQQMATGRFPRPVRIGRRAVGWPQSVIDNWIEERKAEAGFGAGTLSPMARNTDPARPEVASGPGAACG